MARASDRIAENVDGDFFVDRSCIDCDLCRQLAPATFARADRAGQSFVARQPASPAERYRALMALVTCPTSSIGADGAHGAGPGGADGAGPGGADGAGKTPVPKQALAAAREAFPEHVATHRTADGQTIEVAFCGYASEASYGASAWLVRRPGGNVLVDSPRFASALVERIATLGGIRYMVLTHRDDVADHARFAERFGCERIIHRADADAAPEAERIVDGPVDLAPDLKVVPVPGHTRGSIVLIASDTFAFTGDHVWADEVHGGLAAGREVCWYSWPEQRASMLRLAEHRFTHVLPGHGRRFSTATPEAMQRALRDLAGAM